MELTDKFFSDLYEYYFEKVYLHLRGRFGLTCEQAEDLTQDAFVKLFGRFKSKPEDFRKTDEHLRKFIINVSVNLAIDSYRKNKLNLLTEGIYESVQEKTVSGDAPDIVLSVEDLQINLLEGLSDVGRTLLQKSSEGYSYKEIALELGMNVSTVGTNISRCRKVLRSQLMHQQR